MSNSLKHTLKYVSEISFCLIDSKVALLFIHTHTKVHKYTMKKKIEKKDLEKYCKHQINVNFICFLLFCNFLLQIINGWSTLIYVENFVVFESIWTEKVKRTQSRKNFSKWKFTQTPYEILKPNKLVGFEVQLSCSDHFFM